MSTALFQLDIVTIWTKTTLQLKRKYQFTFQGARHFDTNFIVMVFVTIAFVSGILPYCFLSSQITTILESIGSHVFASFWYLWPVTQQKHIRMIIRCGQVERRYTGYHLIDCSMMSFLKVHFATTYAIVVPVKLHNYLWIIYRSLRRQYPIICCSNNFLMSETHLRYWLKQLLRIRILIPPS